MKNIIFGLVSAAVAFAAGSFVENRYSVVDKVKNKFKSNEDESEEDKDNSDPDPVDDANK